MSWTSPSLPRRVLVVLLARLDASPLPVSDPVRLDLEAEASWRIAAVERHSANVVVDDDPA